MVVLSYSSLVTVILTVWGAVALAKEPIRDNERSAADYTQKTAWRVRPSPDEVNLVVDLAFPSPAWFIPPITGMQEKIRTD